MTSSPGKAFGHLRRVQRSAPAVSTSIHKVMRCSDNSPYTEHLITSPNEELGVCLTYRTPQTPLPQYKRTAFSYKEKSSPFAVINASIYVL